MTTQHIIETSVAASVAGVTTAGAMIGADVAGLWSMAVPIGVSAIVGYFSATATTRRDIGVITERENNHFGEIMRRLDLIESIVRSRSHPPPHHYAQAQSVLDDTP